MGKGRLIQALQLAGSSHKYQQVLLLLLSILWIQRVFIFLSAPYIYMDPLFHCSSRGDHFVHQKQACKMIDQCQLSNFICDNKVDDFTLTSHLNLYCGLQWARLTIQSIFPIGSFAGLMVINLISDTRGRRTAVLLDLGISVIGVLCNFLLIFIGALVGGNTHNVYLLILAQFMLGFGAYSLITLGYTILADFFSDQFRHIGIVVISAMAGCAVFIIGVLYIMRLNWLYFILYFQFLPLIVLTVAFYYFLYESPYVLMNHNEQQAAEEVLCKIAVFNGRKEHVAMIRMIIEEQQRDHTHKPTLHKIFKMIKEWRFLKPIIVLVVINGMSNLNYFGMTYSFSQEGLGFGVNSMIFGFVQMISFVVSRYTVKNIPRKWGIMCFFGAVMGLNMLFGFQFVHHSTILSSLIFGVARILSLNAYCLIVCMQTQAFSVYIQSTAAGLIEGFGLYGAFFAPLVVETANYLDINPVVFIGFFVSFAVWPEIFLEETFHKPLIMDEPKSSTVFDPLNNSYQSIELAKISRRLSSPDPKLSKILAQSKSSIKYSNIEH